MTSRPQDAASPAEHPGGAIRAQLTADSVRDGADNQVFVDEIRPQPPTTDIGDPNMPEELAPFVGLLRYPGPNNVEDGIVAVSHREQPSLENPGIAYYGRSYAEGKKITWRDGIKAAWVLVRQRLSS